MATAWFGRWAALGAPLVLAGTLVAGGAAVAQESSALPALDAQVAEVIDQVEVLREFERTSELVWQLAARWVY